MTPTSLSTIKVFYKIDQPEKKDHMQSCRDTGVSQCHRDAIKSLVHYSTMV